MAWIAKSYLIKIKEYQRGIKTDYLALCTNQESIALVLVWFLDQLTNEGKKKKKNTGIFKTIIGPTLYFQSLNDWWSRIPGTFLKRINFTFISPLCREIIPMDGLIAQSVLFLCVPKCVSYQLISVKVWVFFLFHYFAWPKTTYVHGPFDETKSLFHLGVFCSLLNFNLKILSARILGSF